MSNTRYLLIAVVFFLFCQISSGQNRKKDQDVAEALKGYFTLATDLPASPDEEGFIRRWMMLEPISKPNRTNRVFTDTYTRQALTQTYFKDQMTVLPKNGDKVTVEMSPYDLSKGRITWRSK